MITNLNHGRYRHPERNKGRIFPTILDILYEPEFALTVKLI